MKRLSPRKISRALTIAGSDSGGGAGVRADLKTFAAFSVYGTSAIVALTDQNTREVTAIHEVPPEIVRAQIDAVVSDIGVDAAKTGMLGSGLLVETVAEAVAALGIPNLVVDPVMVSKAGAPLLKPEAVEILRRRLLPLARVVTPNLPEAEILSGVKLDGAETLRRAAREIHGMGPRAVVIKGGRGGGDPVDLFFDGKSFLEFPGTRIRTRSDHGTGCTFSAAIAALLARGGNCGRLWRRRSTTWRRRSAQPAPWGRGTAPSATSTGLPRTTSAARVLPPSGRIPGGVLPPGAGNYG